MTLTTAGVAVTCLGVVHIYRADDGTDVVALRGVDLDIDAGERLTLLGPSGSGKSTLLNLLGGLQRPSAGQILIDGEDISRRSEPALVGLRANRVSTLLQGAARNLLPYGSALDNVEFVRRALPRGVRRQLPSARELLASLGLDASAGKPVHQLSGGEQQRVALAVGVANGPGLLLADEPTSQLSSGHRWQVIELLARVNEEFGTTVIVVSHDADVAQRLGRTVTIRDGRVGAEGMHGEEFAVVGVDGSIHLPERLLAHWPAGTLIQVEPEPELGAARLTKVER